MTKHHPDADAIFGDIADRPADLERIDASEVWVDVDPEGTVHLTGTVASRWSREMVAEECLAVDGVHQVDNDLDFEGARPGRRLADEALLSGRRVYARPNRGVAD